MTETEFSHRDHVNTLFVQHSPRIRGFILSILPNMSRADDVLQETFLTVSAKADDFILGTNFVAWACRIAQFKVLEECKQSRKSACAFSEEVIETLCCSQPEIPGDVRDDQLVALKDCLGHLPPHTRRVVELRYTRAHQIPEIAEILGWTVDSVYVLLSRARSKLQECINQKMEIEIDG